MFCMFIACLLIPACFDSYKSFKENNVILKRRPPEWYELFHQNGFKIVDNAGGENSFLLAVLDQLKIAKIDTWKSFSQLKDQSYEYRDGIIDEYRRLPPDICKKFFNTSMHCEFLDIMTVAKLCNICITIYSYGSKNESIDRMDVNPMNSPIGINIVYWCTKIGHYCSAHTKLCSCGQCR